MNEELTDPMERAWAERNPGQSIARYRMWKVMAAQGSEWARQQVEGPPRYVHAAYPSWRYHRVLSPRLVKSADEAVAETPPPFWKTTPFPPELEDLPEVERLRMRVDELEKQLARSGASEGTEGAKR